MRIKNYLILLLTIISWQSNFAQKIDPFGKIFIEDSQARGKIVLFDNGTRSEFFLPKDVYIYPRIKGKNDTSFFGIEPMNNFGSIIIKEKVYNSEIGRLRENLILINSKGIKIDEIYHAELGERIISYDISPKDSKLLFTSYIVPDHLNTDATPYELILPLDINIFDVNNKKLIKKIEKFYCKQNFSLYYLPWSSDENKFVYTIGEFHKITDVDENGAVEQVYGINTGKKESGLYIYDLLQDTHTLIVPDARDGSWSPDGKYIAYKKEEKIWLYDLQTGASSIFYKPVKDEVIVRFHWSPDSQYILMVCGGLGIYLERLIKINDLKEYKFDNLGLKNNHYRWIK